ncbi:MAG TPA: branched-chain amino acid ABC transporter permease, partial [bacterium]
AFYYNNLFPEQIFNIGRSIEIILGPIIGGLGSLFGPILGAFVLTLLGESLRLGMSALKLDVPGITQVFYGVCLLAVMMFLPNGIWPPLKRVLGLDVTQKKTEPQMDADRHR